MMVMEMFELLWELPNCDREAKWTDAVRKMVLTDLLDAVTTNLQFLKKKKFIYLCLEATTEGSSVKQGVPLRYGDPDTVILLNC